MFKWFCFELYSCWVPLLFLEPSLCQNLSGSLSEPVKSGMILNRTTTTPFRVNELVTFYELNSRLLVYMLIPPTLTLVFL